MMIRCWWCPEDTPSPVADLVMVRAAYPSGDGRPVYACPACVAEYRPRPLPGDPAQAMAAVLGAVSAGLLIALVTLAVAR
jgi:hypothetical protein